jgi:hypothetical protein
MEIEQVYVVYDIENIIFWSDDTLFCSKYLAIMVLRLNFATLYKMLKKEMNDV